MLLWHYVPLVPTVPLGPVPPTLVLVAITAATHPHVYLALQALTAQQE